MKSTKLMLLFILILTLSLVSAIDFTPSGNINGRGVYTIYNFTNITATHFYGDGTGITGLTTDNANYSTYANTSTYLTLYSNILSGRPTSLLNLTNDYNYINKTQGDTYWLGLTDQRYNETDLINAVNTTDNIKNLGFNTTSELNNTFLTTESDPVWTSVASDYYTNTQVNNIIGNETLNRVNNDSSLTLSINGVNSSLTQETNSRIANDTLLNNRIDAVNISIIGNATSLTTEIIDRQSNDTLHTNRLNTINISVVGNATSLINEINNRISNDSLFYLKTNPNSYYNSSTIPSYATITQFNNLYNNVTTLQTTTNGLYVNLTNEISARVSIGNWSSDKSSYATVVALSSVNSTAVGKASPGSCPDGQVVMNTTTSGVQCVTVAGSVSTINRSQVINNWASCPDGSAQISENETGRYCDATFLNSSDLSGYVNYTGATNDLNLGVNNLLLGNLINMSNVSDANYGSIFVGRNADNEKSVIIRSSRSADYYLGASGYFNIFNRSNSWIFYVRETDGLITTRNYGTAANWYSAYGWGNHAVAGYSTVTALNSVNTTAVNALPKSGGTMTGAIVMGGNNLTMNTGVYSYANTSCMFFVTPTMNMTIGC